MIVWITKYALSKGLFAVSADEIGVASGHFGVKDEHGYGTNYYHKNDFKITRGEAAGAAIEMRKKKIASLKKQIKKLEGLKFE